MCECFASICVSGAWGVNRPLYALELELKTVESHHVGAPTLTQALAGQLLLTAEPSAFLAPKGFDFNWRGAGGHISLQLPLSFFPSAGSQTTKLKRLTASLFHL